IFYYNGKIHSLILDAAITRIVGADYPAIQSTGAQSCIGREVIKISGVANGVIIVADLPIQLRSEVGPFSVGRCQCPIAERFNSTIRQAVRVIIAPSL